MCSVEPVRPQKGRNSASEAARTGERRQLARVTSCLATHARGRSILGRYSGSPLSLSSPTGIRTRGPHPGKVGRSALPSQPDSDYASVSGSEAERYLSDRVKTGAGEQEGENGSERVGSLCR